jgi:hypothetical protein
MTLCGGVGKPWLIAWWPQLVAMTFESQSAEWRRRLSHQVTKCNTNNGIAVDGRCLVTLASRSDVESGHND